MAISYGQRSAFGRRYGGAGMGNELSRLRGEYGLASGRNSMGMQADQYAQSLAQNQAQYERSFAQSQANFERSMGLQAEGMNAGKHAYDNVPGAYGYLSRYPEVASNNFYAKDPYAHYLQYGQKEGKTWIGDPSPEWSDAEKDAFYLYMYPDVRNAGMTGKNHYLLYGQNEGRFWPSRAPIQEPTVLAPGSSLMKA